MIDILDVISYIATIFVALLTATFLVAQGILVAEPNSLKIGKSERPIMVLLDLLGRRWVLRILWELRDGPLTSRALRTACDEISPSVLQKRINELRQADFVGLNEGKGYALTRHGQDLLKTFGPLTKWAEDWQNSLS